MIIGIPAVAAPQYNNAMQPPIDYTLKNTTSPLDAFNKGFQQSQDRQRANLEIERMKLENERLRLEIQKAKQVQINSDSNEDED